MRGAFDFDHLGAKVGHHRRSGGAGDVRSAVDYADSGEDAL